ncbi:MAG: hypothetical protein AAF937_09995 [Planctomycetota bacterium]
MIDRPASQLAIFRALLIALIGVVMLGAGQRPPEPDPLPQRWELDFVPGPLRVISLDVPGEGSRPFFYMTYRVTNNSGEDLQFAPLFEVGNENGDVVRAGSDVPRSVRQSLLTLLDNPLLEDQIQIIGPILQGRENAKDGLVIWRAPNLTTDELAVYAAGFSGETQQVEFQNPDTGESETMTFRKTYMVRYTTPGTLVGQGSKPLRVVSERWIMR